MLATIVGYSLMIGTVLVCLLMLLFHTGRMGARRIIGINDGDTPKRYFLLLLGQAKRKMVVYDDGNKVEDSFYWDDEVLRAIAEKLQQHPDFEMQCLFNCSVPDSLSSKFAGQSPIHLKTTGLGDTAPREAHIKVIDNGRMAYLSKHEYGSMFRPYELVDCLTVAGWALKGVVKRELGDCLNRFDQEFNRASTV